MSQTIPEKFTKPYDYKTVEGPIYKKWEESGCFNPDVCIKKGVTAPDAETFSIVLPPPNVTGTLHMGSALMLVIEDILVRHARMSGKRTLWIPGTDSAAIATQSKVEKEIQKKEKKSRYDIGREELLKRIDVFVEESKGTILRQIRSIGASVDWSRYAYTMDEKRYHAVMTAFVRMYEAGLIYRGNRIVNWDPKGQTTISDDEIVYEERTAKLYTFKYSKDFPIPISTTRPETKVGDVAVAVHPDDERYAAYIGKEYDAVFCDVPIHIKIIADYIVEKEFGTGALGVTPAHSQTDWEIADRHDLTRPQVIDERARMTVGGRLHGMKTTDARGRINCLISRFPKLQWFINVEKSFTLPHSTIPNIKSGDTTTLKAIMQNSVEDAEGGVHIIGENFKKIYLHWIENLRPWCISRQIWFGHRIPVWYRGDEQYCGMEAPSGDGWERDPDVLDTWFSSALWTCSTLGWPDDTSDLRSYHPTALIETGYDILFFWVARMILMSGFLLGEVPFKTVSLHGLVRDEKGRKISKSLGNNIDPMDMGEKYGTDAVRVSLIAGMAPGTDSNISEAKINGYKKFANKLWNITRFILENSNGDEVLSPENKKALWDLHLGLLIKEVTTHIETYRIDLAAETLYQFIWHELADKIIEESKSVFRDGTDAEKAQKSAELMEILRTSLKLLHPFMPFITEEIWSSLPHTLTSDKSQTMLILEKWPS